MTALTESGGPGPWGGPGGPGGPLRGGPEGPKKDKKKRREKRKKKGEKKKEERKRKKKKKEKEKKADQSKLIKNYLRSNMGQERLVDLAILGIESDLAKSIDFDSIINSFAAEKARRVVL